MTRVDEARSKQPSLPSADWEPWEWNGRSYLIGPDGWSCVEMTPDGWRPANGAVVQHKGRCVAARELPRELEWLFPRLPF
jgi:hypothetical protein